MTTMAALHTAPVAVIIPADPAGDPHRIAALGYVATWYQQHFPRWPIHVGTTDGPWSKGLAVRSALVDVEAEVYVIADADSFIADPAQLRATVDDVGAGRRQWSTPHQFVYRLKPDETTRVLAGAKPRLGCTHRAPYEGPIGGGITVVTATAWDTVNGIDPAFQGWGGEDLAFGWALETLCQPGGRDRAELVHLWHPHPAPTLRGSPESEALVDLYKQARGRPRRMRHLLDHGTLPDIDPVDPVTFRMTGQRRTLRIGGGSVIVRFERGTYTTTDPDEIDALRASGIVTEEKRRATP